MSADIVNLRQARKAKASELLTAIDDWGPDVEGAATDLDTETKRAVLLSRGARFLEADEMSTMTTHLEALWELIDQPVDRTVDLNILLQVIGS